MKEKIQERPSILAPSAIKSFRHQAAIEDFYRFIYENDLRFEALEILDVFVEKKRQLKALKKKKNSLH